MPRSRSAHVGAADRAGRAVAALALVPAAPVMLAVALAVRLALGRPVLFQQQRAGRDGMTFSILKFRTMSDARDGAGRPLPDDERLGPLGRALRRVRLDELPQLVCIARGDMAWVGPRPLRPETIARGGALGAMRSAVRPGLTGWAQVCGNTRLDDRAKLALDVWYARHATPGLDALILLMTVRTLVLGERLDAARIARAEAFVRGLGTEGLETEPGGRLPALAA